MAAQSVSPPPQRVASALVALMAVPAFSSAFSTTYFGRPLPSHSLSSRCNPYHVQGASSPRRRARLSMNHDDSSSMFSSSGFESHSDITCGDALREWICARDRGETPRDRASCAAARVDVLFVGRDNSTVSVAAEAIFTDLCERRALDCFSSHSVGTKVGREGDLPDWQFVEALRIKRGLDVSRKMACSLSKSDAESYSLVVCMDEQTRSELLYMMADENGRFGDELEQRIVLLSDYCSEPKLRAMQFRSGKYAKDALNFLIAALVDACSGLLTALIESPPIPQA